MSLFQYEAFSPGGEKVKGMIDAINESDAKERLRDQRLLLVSLKIKQGVQYRQNLKGQTLLTFTLQLSQLLSSGIPVYESLSTLEEQSRRESYHPVLLGLCEKIKSGLPLSDAMSQYPGSFNSLYIAMIKAGEASGQIDAIMDKLSHLLNKQQKLQKQAITSFIYPIILSGFCIVVIALLLGFVVPSLEGIFEGRELNGFTHAVISASKLFRSYWFIGFALVALLGFFFYYQARTAQGKIFIQKMMITTPFIRHVVIQIAMSRFLQTMGTLLQGGLTMIDSLRISKKIMNLAPLEEFMTQVEGKIIEGSSLSYELSKSPLIPRLVCKMVAIGEEAGKLSTMLNRIADIYEDELDKTLSRLMALAQPVILVVMGFIIGAVLLAVLLPLTDVASFTMK